MEVEKVAELDGGFVEDYGGVVEEVVGKGVEDFLFGNGILLQSLFLHPDVPQDAEFVFLVVELGFLEVLFEELGDLLSVDGHYFLVELQQTQRKLIVHSKHLRQHFFLPVNQYSSIFAPLEQRRELLEGQLVQEEVAVELFEELAVFQALGPSEVLHYLVHDEVQVIVVGPRNFLFVEEKEFLLEVPEQSDVQSDSELRLDYLLEVEAEDGRKHLQVISIQRETDPYSVDERELEVTEVVVVLLAVEPHVEVSALDRTAFVVEVSYELSTEFLILVGHFDEVLWRELQLILEAF